MVKLTKTEKEILKDALQKGFLTIDSLNLFYKTQIAQKQAITRFRMLDLIEQNENTLLKLKINPEKIRALL